MKYAPTIVAGMLLFALPLAGSDKTVPVELATTMVVATGVGIDADSHG